MSNSKTKNGKAKNLLVSDDLLEKVKGNNLVNKKYEMWLNYFMEFSDNVFRVVMDNYMNDDGDTHIAHHDLVFGELAERREKNRQTIVKKKLVLREKQKKKTWEILCKWQGYK